MYVFQCQRCSYRVEAWTFRKFQELVTHHVDAHISISEARRNGWNHQAAS